FIPITVILETEWVLRYTYGFSRETIGEALTRLMNLPNVTSSDDAALKLALSWHRQGLDFSDALHLACSRSTDCLIYLRQALHQVCRGIDPVQGDCSLSHSLQNSQTPAQIIPPEQIQMIQQMI